MLSDRSRQAQEVKEEYRWAVVVPVVSSLVWLLEGGVCLLSARRWCGGEASVEEVVVVVGAGLPSFRVLLLPDGEMEGGLAWCSVEGCVCVLHTT